MSDERAIRTSLRIALKCWAEEPPPASYRAGYLSALESLATLADLDDLATELRREFDRTLEDSNV